MTADTHGPARRVAAAALGVDAADGRGRVRSAFLAQVAEAGLAPEPKVRAAAAEFGVIPNSASGRAVLDSDAAADHGTAIEQFANDYWDLTPAERRARWFALRDAADRRPRLVARLEDLADGLDFVPPSDIDAPAESRLAEVVVELYPLRPAARARRRAQLMPRVGSPEVVKRASQALYRRHPDLEQVDHGLLEAMSFVRPPVSPIRTTPVVRPVRTREPAESSSGSSNRWAWILIPLCISVCSGLSRMGRTTNDTRTSNTASYSNFADQARADRERLASSTSIRPETYDALAKIMNQRLTVKTGLTSTQRDILLALRSKAELSEVEAHVLAVKFLADDPPRPPGASSGPKPFVREPAMNPAQREVWNELAYTAGLTVDQVRDLLIRFVKAAGGSRQP